MSFRASGHIERLPSELMNAYDVLLDFQINQAREIVKQYNPNTPQDVSFSIILESLADIVELTLSEDNSLYKAYSKNEARYLSDLKSISTKSDWKTFAMAEIRLHWSYARYRKGDEIGAALHLFKAWDIVKKGMNSNPDFLPYYRTFGMMNMLLGAVPEKYNWFLNLLGIDASIPQGISSLHKCISESKSIYALESYYILTTMHAFIIPGIELDDLHNNNLAANNNKLIFKYLKSIINIKTRNVDTALKMLNELLVTNIPFHFPVIHYWAAECLVRKGDYINAAVFYKSFIRKFKGVNLVKDANYKLSNIYYLSENQELAEKYRLLAKKVKGKSIASPDGYADKQLEQDSWPDKYLYKARLSYDGGYYDQAMEFLHIYKQVNKDIWNSNVEYHYRLARVLHAKNNLERAINEYKITIALSEGLPDYYAPNATLNLGYIFTHKGEINAARSYFTDVLSYKGYAYKSSLNTQARVALQIFVE